jgi:hypothetical protein
MKKFTVLFVLVYIQLISYSQDTVKCWNITRYDESFSPQHPTPTWTYYGLKTGADTIIGEESYKKLYHSSDSLFLETSILGGIREDSNRIYFSKSRYSAEEFLLYDFNINSGDSIMVYRMNGIDYFSIHPLIATVDSVNTRMMGGGIRKQLYIEYICIDHTEYRQKDIWIDGIGSIMSGLLNIACRCGTGCYTKSYLTCYSENNATIWWDSAFSSCYIGSNKMMDIDEEIIQEDLVSITTIGKRIQIQSRHPISSIRVMNLQGQTVFLDSNVHFDFYEFYLKNQVNGLYIIIINDLYSHKMLLY